MLTPFVSILPPKTASMMETIAAWSFPSSHRPCRRALVSQQAIWVFSLPIDSAIALPKSDDCCSLVSALYAFARSLYAVTSSLTLSLALLALGVLYLGFRALRHSALVNLSNSCRQRWSLGVFGWLPFKRPSLNHIGSFEFKSGYIFASILHL